MSDMNKRTIRPKLDDQKLSKLKTFQGELESKYGRKGTPEREEFEAKARAWYYAECLKEARKKAGLTQQDVADKIGMKRTYISLIERITTSY